MWDLGETKLEECGQKRHLPNFIAVQRAQAHCETAGLNRARYSGLP